MEQSVQMDPDGSIWFHTVDLDPLKEPGESLETTLRKPAVERSIFRVGVLISLSSLVLFLVAVDVAVIVVVCCRYRCQQLLCLLL